jgi:hypothetical protein
MKERFRHHENNAITSLESQVTASSAGNDARLSQVSLNGHVPDPLTTSDRDYHPELAPSPELGVQTIGLEADEPQAWDIDITESIDDLVALENFDPEGLIDSQNSTISEMALETRLQAFQTVLDKAKGKTGGEIGLISTTDNHSKLEEELG